MPGEAQEKLNEILEQSVVAMAEAMSARDPYTAQHQAAVVDLSVTVAKALGMDESRIQGLRLAAMIHDLGNLTIPVDILNKPGKLSDVEFELVKTHSRAGYDIVKGIDFPWPIAEIILQHHEHMDGSGYPRGLKGDEILPESRIVTTVNVIESMTTYRPCRDPLPMETAIAEIKKYRGTKYDAPVVDACVRVLDAG